MRLLSVIMSCSVFIIGIIVAVMKLIEIKKLGISTKAELTLVKILLSGIVMLVVCIIFIFYFTLT